MRAEFDLFHLRRSTEGRKLELFVTVAAPFDIVEVAYNVRALNRLSSFDINIRTSETQFITFWRGFKINLLKKKGTLTYT
jgi:hypothetical protein